MLNFLDILYYVFHMAIILFNTLGWISPKTRKANLALLTGTFFSWFGLGLIYGIGYCPFTQWHWEVKAKLGQGPLPANYIQHIFQKFLDLDLESKTVDFLTFTIFFGSLILSLALNYRDIKNNGKNN
jgi:hypothetical protein